VKPANRLILLILVLALLYFGALALGLSRNHAENPTPDQSKRDWLKSLGRLTAPFAPRLDANQLFCNSQLLKNGSTLTYLRPSCTVPIPEDSHRDYRHADLEVLPSTPGGPAGVYVLATYEEKDFPQDKRDSQCSLVMPQQFGLAVQYTPHNEHLSHPWHCWLLHDAHTPVSLGILKEGGDLSLTCIGGCNVIFRRQISIRLK
jgi:hypothetical protein